MSAAVALLLLSSTCCCCRLRFGYGNSNQTIFFRIFFSNFDTMASDVIIHLYTYLSTNDTYNLLTLPNSLGHSGEEVSSEGSWEEEDWSGSSGKETLWDRFVTYWSECN